MYGTEKNRKNRDYNYYLVLITTNFITILRYEYLPGLRATRLLSMRITKRWQQTSTTDLSE